MPLPGDTTLTLQGQPRPGDPLHSKPKQAMLFRMSAETFEQLEDAQNMPTLQFEFGENPGLYINDTFFPVTANPENGPHELYLRMASAQKPMAPLKMYANVIGKFMVERQLGEKVEGTVRDRTLEAEKERKERKVQYLDAPPDLTYPGKGKRKDAAAPRRPVAVSAPHSIPSSTRVSRVASPLPGTSSHANGSTNEVPPTKARLIHCLAIKPRTTEAIFTMCAGRDPTPQMKKELITLLRNVAEPRPMAKGSDAPQSWQLKLEAWRDVRPYEWPMLTSEERVSISRQARKAYKDLKIPESDPVWQHARYRELATADAVPGAPAKPVAGPSVQAPEPKKGMISKGTVKKAKAGEGVRKKVPDIIIAKDESARGGRDEYSVKGKARERDFDEDSAAGTPTSATRPTNRRLPGSGYKVKPSATPPAEARAHSPLPASAKRTGPVDARESRRELPLPSGSAKPLPPIAPPPPAHEHKTSGASTPQFKKRLKDSPALMSQRATEERREERQRDRDRPSVSAERQRPRAQGSPVTAVSFKRKKRPQPGDDSEFSERELPLSSVTKKRKVDERHASPEKPRPRDLSLPKKPAQHEPSPLGASRTKVKKEASSPSLAPSPPPSSAPRSSLPPRPSLPEKPQPPSSASSSSSTKEDPPHRSSSSSKRRRSPIYTSSDDEPSAPPEPAAKRSHKAKQLLPHGLHFKARTSMPADRSGLRGYYKQVWLVYIRLYQEHAQRRDRIERMLGEEEGRGRERERDATGDASEDDGDVGELDPEALFALATELRRATDEINKIKKAWERLGGSLDSFGALVDE
ncbi:hypothetical protein C8Q79DRAFT_1070849 [Trametes meyenii]|nr:hypothetical protein C8Q79DRAFT_1070849 [Trametes meyenii]